MKVFNIYMAKYKKMQPMRMPGSFSIAGKYKTGRLQLLLINTIVLKSPFCKNPKIRKNRMPVCIFLIGSQPGYFVFRTVFNFYDICPVPVDHQYCQQPAGRDNLHADMQLHNRDIDTAGKCSAHAGQRYHLTCVQHNQKYCERHDQIPRTLEGKNGC